MAPLRAAMYARVAPDDPLWKNSLSNQVSWLSEWTEWSDCEVVRVYREEAADAASHRPVLDQMLEDARRRTFDLLFVVETSRLAPNAVTLSELLSRLAEWEVEVVSVLDEEDCP